MFLFVMLSFFHMQPHIGQNPNKLSYNSEVVLRGQEALFNLVSNKIAFTGTYAKV